MKHSRCSSSLMISSSIEDRWFVTRDGEKVPSDRHGKRGRYRVRYRLDRGARQLYSPSFERKRDAEQWLRDLVTDLQTGRYVDPKRANMTVQAWSETWLKGYGSRKKTTVRMAEVHLKIINATFGDVPLIAVKPSDVNAWVAEMQKDGRAQSYVYAVYRRFAQLMGDAVHDGIIPRSPCSRRTAPGQGQQRPYVATLEQVWQIHDLFPENLRAAVLLAAFAGLRLGECAGLRAADVDFMRGVITPAVQYPDEDLKTDYSKTPIPIPNELSLQLSKAVALGSGEWVVTSPIGRQSTPWQIERAMREVRPKVEGLPDGFRFHDFRHFYASLLIASGLDVKVVQKRLRHKNATTTLNVYAHMFPDKDEAARAAVAAAFAARAAPAATESPVSPSGQ